MCFGNNRNSPIAKCVGPSTTVSAGFNCTSTAFNWVFPPTYHSFVLNLIGSLHRFVSLAQFMSTASKFAFVPTFHFCVLNLILKCGFLHRFVSLTQFMSTALDFALAFAFISVLFTLFSYVSILQFLELFLVADTRL